MRTDQRVQHHMDRRRRTLSRLEATTWWTRGRNGSRTRVRVKTSNSTIPGLTSGRALSPRWSRKRSEDRPIRVDHRRHVPGLVDTSELEIPNVNPYTTKEETLRQTVSSRRSNSPIRITAACKRVSCSIKRRLTDSLSWQQLNFLSSTRTRRWSRSSKERAWLSPCKAPLSLLSKRVWVGRG